ncbi:DUF4209 domain-containing protein [Microbacterium esteraromaticum]|uniref:DUF4209 domain-containing protein n=1 Tax=Microbacterium esteraromaticum TaxID=57043 RepID=UPI0023675516|nr:DUF4209 domain-containing protein [Microbacterium esteraromaticum]WDH79326.1 DUF4209 domain-containing protein [Microbacterium esteraromaticum]
MTEHQPSSPEEARWIAALDLLVGTGVFRIEAREDEERLPSLWSRLRQLADDAESPDATEVASLLSRVASFIARPDDWAQPYEPMVALQEGRSTIPNDLTEEELSILGNITPVLPDTMLRVRVADVLAVCSSGRERMKWYEIELDALCDQPGKATTRPRETDAWDRALLVARRHGAVFDEHLDRLVSALTGFVFSANVSEHPGAVADLLVKHNLARSDATDIAERLRELAAEFSKSNLDACRAYRRRAAQWFDIAKDLDQANIERLAIVRSYIAEAETLDAHAEAGSHARSGHLYEQALKTLRLIPRRRREALGVGNLTADLARRIRSSGAATLGMMGVFESDPVDLADLRAASRSKVSGKEPLAALREFIDLASFASYEADHKQAEELIQEHPLQSLFSNTHFSHDGRVIHRSSGRGGEPIYGEDPSVWRQMIQIYEFRISLTVQGALAPAWVALSNDHRLSVGDFLQLTQQSSIVPSDRERLFAQALYYGYDGDFITAAQLLAPQLEHLVRLHLRNAGQSTTTIDERGIENEIGLSALMTRDSTTEIFGPNLAYEIRALFCGPIGPNLRNQYAHGLSNDSAVGSVEALYCWWFMLRLVFVTFWNHMHDAQTADNHEPAERSPAEPNAAS